MTSNGTHETYIHQTREAIVASALQRATIDADQATRLEHTKLVYGVGDGTYRGITAYEAWQNGIGLVDVVEIAASAEESWVQLAGTTVHELAHVLAGKAGGHEKAWRDACARLGLARARAAGQRYLLSQLDPSFRSTVYELARSLGDGRPEMWTTISRPIARPCSQGIGSRGGTSRGKGSGSRLLLWECTGCEKPQKVRVASTSFRATHDDCGTAFVSR